MKRKLERNAPHQRYFLRDGTGPLPGASTICKIGDDPGGLIHWAWKKGAAGEDYRHEVDAAADAGEIGHALANAYLIGDELDLSEYSPESQELGQISFNHFKDWWEQGDYIFIASELQLVSHEHKFGGTLDILARNREDEICLIDLKRVKKLRASQGIQVGGYGLLVHENFESPVDEACLLRMPREDKPVEPLWLDKMSFPYYQKAFLANLQSHHAREALERVLPKELRIFRYYKKGTKKE